MPDLRPEYWRTVPLQSMTSAEWDALCDGCGKCCLKKFTVGQPERILVTRIACPLLDTETCRCSSYETRHDYIPACVVLTVEKLETATHWLPTTCAYKRLFDGDELPDWHPLLTGDTQSPHLSGNSARGQTRPPIASPPPDWDWQPYALEWLPETIRAPAPSLFPAEQAPSPDDEPSPPVLGNRSPDENDPRRMGGAV